MKNLNNTLKGTNKRNVIKKEDLKNLDEFIQKCLDKFKFVEPNKELYGTTGIDKDLIISHKSTIPDLVIWNKTFNKNNCFIGANTSHYNEFPRYLFYIKIKKNKKSKHLNIQKIMILILVFLRTSIQIKMKKIILMKISILLKIMKKKIIILFLIQIIIIIIIKSMKKKINFLFQ